MHDLIKQAFNHVEVIGPQVHRGQYDLIGPDGQIILPQIWEKVVEPDWSIEMKMWPESKIQAARPIPPFPIPPNIRHGTPEWEHFARMQQHAARARGGAPGAIPLRPAGGVPATAPPPPPQHLRGDPIPQQRVHRGHIVDVVDAEPRKKKNGAFVSWVVGGKTSKKK